MKRYLYNLNSAVEAVFNNKFRSVLTALGIIFGVAAVIAMMAIGNGARQEILEQIKMVGVNNIVITPKIEDKEKQQQSDDTEVASQIHKKSSPGLTLADATSIREIVPGVQKVSPEVVYNTFVVKSGVSLLILRSPHISSERRFPGPNIFSELLAPSSPVVLTSTMNIPNLTGTLICSTDLVFFLVKYHTAKMSTKADIVNISSFLFIVFFNLSKIH